MARHRLIAYVAVKAKLPLCIFKTNRLLEAGGTYRFEVSFYFSRTCSDVVGSLGWSHTLNVRVLILRRVGDSAEVSINNISEKNLKGINRFNY